MFWETGMSWHLRKKLWRFVRKQTWATFIWQIQIFKCNRSSVRLSTNSTCKSTLKFTHRSTSRSAKQIYKIYTIYKKSTADLQAVQHWWVQTIHQLFISWIQFPFDLSIHKKTQWLILLKLIRDQFLTGQMITAYWNDSDNGRKKWRFSSEVL